MQVRLEEKTSSYLQFHNLLAPNFTKLLQAGLDALLDLPPIEDAYIAGSLVLVPVRNLQETYHISFKEQIRKYITPKLKAQVYELSVNQIYPRTLQAGARIVLDFIDKLDNNQGRSQNLQQASIRSDQYYAFPFICLMVKDSLEAYFREQGELAEERPFRRVLQEYIRASYPSDSFLPIGTNYQDVPFVVYRSFSLPEFRRKIFDRAYMLTSAEINVLGMILCMQ